MKLSTKYNQKIIENNKIIGNWKEKEKNDFLDTLLLPPPNITGSLHLGHSLNMFLQDYLIRYSHLVKKPVKWIIGVDHAGISTQRKIENLGIKNLKNNNQKKEYALNFWYPKVLEKFKKQWKKMGLLINYDNIRFTLDLNSRKQVNDAFIKLYNDGFIYRKKRIVNWDPLSKSVISDIEIECLPVKNKLYFLEYLLLDEDIKDTFLVVATSRPETIFADVALLVNPDDKRYRKYIGKWAMNSFVGKKIPILADRSVKIDFGSGILKCTPGHDSIDYERAKTNNLSIISCCDENGILNKLAKEWEGKKINEIRDNLVDKLKKKKICQKIEYYSSNLFISSRSGSIIEPILSTQWFLDLPSVIKKIEKEKRNFWNEISFFPYKFSKNFESWKEKTQEWCISRQLWWGHRIPAWYNKHSGEIIVTEKNPNENVQNEEWEAEKDVLDTWFSSALWPIITSERYQKKLFSTKATNLLITAYDIIFFWVLKMIILCFYFTKEIPFHQVIFHGLIRDEKGKKMSKSLGNGIEPDEIISEYGCDSLRLFLLQNNIWGNDLTFRKEKIKGSWRFCQKIWSVGNLILTRFSHDLSVNFSEISVKGENEISLINKWMLNQLFYCQKKVLFLNQEKKINSSVNYLIDFTKEKLSSSYLEVIKIFPWGNETKEAVSFVFQQLLILLHPVIPFLTGYLYEKFTGKGILFGKIELHEIKNDNLWYVDCLFLIIKKIHIHYQKEKKLANFFLELMPEWNKKNVNNFNFNEICSQLTGYKCEIFNKENNKEFNSFFDIPPFGFLWYLKKEKKNNEKIDFYRWRYEESKKKLENIDFLKKASPFVVEKEKKKKEYYWKLFRQKE